MRRLLSLFLAAFLLLSLCSCSAKPAEESTSAATEADSSALSESVPVSEAPAATETAVAETTVPVETEPSLTGELMLSVSKIDFSLVGDSEDIFIGTADREQVIWESADESVITVENGVLTAVGVGSTTVTAQYGDQTMSCTAGCLAATEDVLNALGEDVLRAPKRYPVVLENPPLELYSDAAFVGDSITYIMFQNETRLGILGHPLFLVRSGTSLNGLVLRYKNVYFRGAEMNFEDAVAASGAKKIFIMLGQNDLRYRTIEDTMSSWDTLIERVKEKVPDAEFYLQSCIYEWYASNADNTQNTVIDTYNDLLIQYCADNGHHYVDIQKFVEDHTGNMATPYSLDQSIHLNEPGCVAWMHALNTYMYVQSIGGTGL